MPTQEIPDNKLDDVFRKAAGEYTPEFEPEAWQRMEKLLDEHGDGAGGYWWKRILLPVAVLLVAALGGWAFLEMAGADKNTLTRELKHEALKAPDAVKNRDQNRESRNTTRTGASSRPDISLSGTPTAPVPTPERTPKGSSVAEKTDDAMVTGNKRVTGNKQTLARTDANSKDAKSTTDKGPLRQRIQATRTEAKKQGSEPVASGNRDDGKNTFLSGLLTGSPEAITGTGSLLPVAAPLTGKGIAVEEAVPDRQQIATPALANQPAIEPEAKRSSNLPRITLGAMVSPDLSSVGFFNRLTPGTNAGLQLEYRLTNRFRVGVGAIYSVKLYAATVEDYTVPKGFWTYGVKPSGIDANCKILDLPVHLRFDAIQRDRYTAFLSTGLSSYIMLSEKYNYSYDSYNPYLKPSWSGKRTGEYYFSVVNLSAGYERSMGRRFTWQAEPFLKLPLGGIGFGKVRLISSGVFLSVKYRLTGNK